MVIRPEKLHHFLEGIEVGDQWTNNCVQQHTPRKFTDRLALITAGEHTHWIVVYCPKMYSIYLAFDSHFVFILCLGSSWTLTWTFWPSAFSSSQSASSCQFSAIYQLTGTTAVRTWMSAADSSLYMSVYFIVSIKTKILGQFRENPLWLLQSQELIRIEFVDDFHDLYRWLWRKATTTWSWRWWVRIWQKPLRSLRHRKASAVTASKSQLQNAPTWTWTSRRAVSSHAKNVQESVKEFLGPIQRHF